VVDAKLGVFQVQIEGIGRYPLELGHTELGKSPEPLNADIRKEKQNPRKSIISGEDCF